MRPVSSLLHMYRSTKIYTYKIYYQNCIYVILSLKHILEHKDNKNFKEISIHQHECLCMHCVQYTAIIILWFCIKKNKQTNKLQTKTNLKDPKINTSATSNISALQNNQPLFGFYKLFHQLPKATGNVPKTYKHKFARIHCFQPWRLKGTNN